MGTPLFSIKPIINAVTCLIFLACCQSALAVENKAEPHAKAQDAYQRMQNGKGFAKTAVVTPDIIPTSDGQSFFVMWKATAANPKQWIVSLHGSRGSAMDDFAIWYPCLQDREVGFLGLQWWIGADDSPSSYYTPSQIYSEVSTALENLGVQSFAVMLHGFSRGSSNSYAVAAIDAGQGRHYFSLIVASSGGVSVDYPPTQAILDGEFGDRPLLNTRWVTAAGAYDSNPDRDGIPAMRRTADWLVEQGAVVIASIEDPNEGHGALQRNPANMQQVLDLFLDVQG